MACYTDPDFTSQSSLKTITTSSLLTDSGRLNYSDIVRNVYLHALEERQVKVEPPASSANKNLRHWFGQKTS